MDLYYIEYDAVCASRWQNKTAGAHVFAGDQADASFLRYFVSETARGGQFDIIVDDGGHTMVQQLTSLEHLWPAVKPGGLYVIEDLQTSFLDNYGGDPPGSNAAKTTTMKHLHQLVDDIMTGRGSIPISRQVLSVDCMAEICALRKKHGNA